MRVFRSVVLCAFVFLCVGLPALMRAQEEPVYQFAKEQLEWAEREYSQVLGEAGGGSSDVDDLSFPKMYYERVKMVVEEYERQLSE